MKRHLIAIIIGGVLVSTVSVAQNAPVALKTATAQKSAMTEASVPLLGATVAAAKANAGLPAVSIYPQLQNGHAVAEVTLLQGTTMKNVTEELD
jgi:hypothetical protein